jgi:8-oxo-dGTP pyrophosphatase MutT (NUDIX family)
LLVFEHGDPGLEAGLQVVAGGIEPGETLEQAAVRETWEEAGLKLENPRFLGTLTLDQPPGTPGRGKPEAWHFWLEAPADTPNAWKHTVLNGGDAGLVYNQRFVPLDDVRLDWNLDAKLETLRSSPTLEEQP